MSDGWGDNFRPAWWAGDLLAAWPALDDRLAERARMAPVPPPSPMYTDAAVTDARKRSKVRTLHMMGWAPPELARKFGLSEGDVESIVRSS